MPCETQLPPDLTAPREAGSTFDPFNRSRSRKNQKAAPQRAQGYMQSDEFKQLVEKSKQRAAERRQEGKR